MVKLCFIFQKLIDVFQAVLAGHEGDFISIAKKRTAKIVSVILAAIPIIMLIGTPTKTTAAATTNWWSKFGKPRYGGEITTILSSIGAVSFDNYSLIGADNQYWLESLWSYVNWTVDRKEWLYNTDFTPEKYCSGNMAKSWEIPDTKTIIVHIKQGITWQKKAPVNGREFTAYDIEAHYDRVLGTGHGFTEPAPMYKGMIPNLEKVSAADKYTVKFKFKQPNGFGLAALMDQISVNQIEAPEWVARGDLQNWKNAVGTSAWVLTDFKEGTHMIFTKNPDYWGYDERYPGNRLPYADKLTMIVIQDIATQMAAFRTGKIDMLRDVPWQQSASILKSNPDIPLAKIPFTASAIGMRNDTAPFNDIRVRKALQLSLDLKAIARGYYGGTAEGDPSGLIAPALKGYAFAYEDWPRSLKDEYGYNPKKAKQLLAEAGYPDGFKTNVAASSMNDRQLLELIKSYFSDIGVDMKINMMDTGIWRAFTGAGKHDQMSTWGFGTQSPNIIMRYSIKTSSQNPLYVNDAEYDALVADFYNTPDPDKVAKIVQAADRMGIEKHYAINLFPPVVSIFWQPYLKGYSGESQLRWGATYLYARMFIDHELKKSMGRKRP